MIPKFQSYATYSSCLTMKFTHIIYKHIFKNYVIFQLSTYAIISKTKIFDNSSKVRKFPSVNYNNSNYNIKSGIKY